MSDDDFHTKEHITKHLTGAQYDLIRERSRVNSADEQAFLNWQEFIARTLTTDKMSPLTYQIYMAGTKLYKKSHGSFKFGFVQKLGGKWLWILIAVIGVVVALLFFTGTINLGG
jgi:hypothetical protein